MLDRIQNSIGLPAILLYWGLGIVSWLLFHSLEVEQRIVGWLLGVPFVTVGILISVGWLLGRKP